MVRKWIDAGLDAVSKAAPDEVTEAVMGRAREAAAQVAELAAGFVSWSGATREAVLREVRERMGSRSWIEEAGLATRADLEALQRRVEDLAARVEGTSPRPGAATRTARSARPSGSGSSGGESAKTATTRKRGSGGTAGARAGR